MSSEMLVSILDFTITEVIFCCDKFPEFARGKDKKMAAAEKKQTLKGTGWIGVTLQLRMHKAWVDRGSHI